MKILIADDEPISRHLLERVLTQWHYQVVVASNGEEAWDILQWPEAPKLAILDWMMPGRDGVQICREVRQQVNRSYTYILLLTARAQKEDLLEGLEAGADDYLTKPFDPEELRVRLRAGRRILDLQDQLVAAREAARFPATLDALTGLSNREAILGSLRREVVQREAGPVGAILADLDRISDVNNLHGRLAGDAVLREAGRRLRSTARGTDAVGRFGGSEFLIVVPGADGEQMVAQANRIHQCISSEPMEILGGAIRVTASLGVASTEEAPDADSLLRALSTAVRRAKGSGRNRVEVFRPAEAGVRDPRMVKAGLAL